MLSALLLEHTLDKYLVVYVIEHRPEPRTSLYTRSL